MLCGLGCCYSVCQLFCTWRGFVFSECFACVRHVDATLRGSNQTLILDMKFNLLKARLSGPGSNTTGSDGLTRARANATSNLNVATILMDPLDFYQVCVPSLIRSRIHVDIDLYVLVLWLSGVFASILRYLGDPEFHSATNRNWPGSLCRH